MPIFYGFVAMGGAAAADPPQNQKSPKIGVVLLKTEPAKKKSANSIKNCGLYTSYKILGASAPKLS